MTCEEIREICKEIRQDIFLTVCKNKAGHLVSSLSSVELLAALYFGGSLHYESNNPLFENRDRFVMSKGHSALAFYYILAKAGYYPKENVNTFCKEGTIFGGLATAGKIPGIEATTGSLGHGLAYASGVALAGRMKKKEYRVFCMIGDGELQEGEIWESSMFAAHHKLNNLTVIIDNNGIQATGFGKNIMDTSPLAEKWNAFGFDIIEVNGHDVQDLIQAYEHEGSKPSVVIANTVKGKGLSFAEGQENWHYKMPTSEQVKQGCADLGMNWEDFFSNER